MNQETNASKIPAPPCVLVIFGMSGDLVKRLLYPAICNIGSDGLLDKTFCIIGISFEPYNNETFRAQLINQINDFITDPTIKSYALELANKVYYISGDFADQKVYSILNDKLSELHTQGISKNTLFYLAVPPSFMGKISMSLGKAGLLTQPENLYFRRLIVEKPFGHDLASAKKLNQELLSVVDENQIFRIDHFLGKETVQNIFAFRFSNGLFEPIWNRLYIDHIQISVTESLGVELRGGYYETAGALRDMVPNHIFQMLSLIMMEPPINFRFDAIQSEMQKVLKAAQVLTPEEVIEHVVRGQYGPGVIDSVEVPAYRSEKFVAPDSSVETYVAMKLLIDTWRWLHVPIYIRTGKRLKRKCSEIIIQFKSGPSTLFADSQHKIMPNLLRIYIQPEEGISLQFNAKIPGYDLELSQVDMKFKYSDYFGIKAKTGYETILYDCMRGDHLLFKNAEMVETEWSLVQPILDVWGALHPRDFPNYPSGSWGPKEADELLEKDGHHWLL